MVTSLQVRSKQTTMGTMLTSAIRDSLGVDVCCLNAGNIRGAKDYPTEFTWFDLRIEIAFPTWLVTLPMKVLLLAPLHSFWGAGLFFVQEPLVCLGG
jgi:hypothetical protein